MQSVWIIGGALFLFALWMFEVETPWIVAGGVAWLGLAFNTIVSAKNGAENALSSIGVMLKKRYDLIPGLIDCAQRYIEHESDVLEKVTRLRAEAISGRLTSAQAVETDNQIGRALSQLFATAEAHPDLKANGSFQDLQRALNEVEEQISAARRTYNAAAQQYNDVVRMFPTNLFAAVLSYRERPYFEVDPAHTERPDVIGRFRSHQAR